MTAPAPNDSSSRRQFLGGGVRGAFLFLLGAATALLARRTQPQRTFWQLDPYKCTYCGRCATHCVLQPSAVKCVQMYPMCGFCRLCTGYFEPQPNQLNTAAENQLCPTGAIKRTAMEDPYYKYDIDEKLCIGCAKCVKGCTELGNGSFHLQIRQDRCVNCNECSIAIACPSQAFTRVPADKPYLFKDPERAA